MAAYIKSDIGDIQPASRLSWFTVQKASHVMVNGEPVQILYTILPVLGTSHSPAEPFCFLVNREWTEKNCFAKLAIIVAIKFCQDCRPIFRVSSIPPQDVIGYFICYNKLHKIKGRCKCNTRFKFDRPGRGRRQEEYCTLHWFAMDVDKRKT